MVSGVGPAETLKKFDIPVVSELPGVGQNMWDHLLFGTSYRADVLTHSAAGNPEFLAQTTEEYLEDGSGMLGNPGGDIIAWEKFPSDIRSQLSKETLKRLEETFPADWPEAEYLALDAWMGDNQNYIEGAPRTPHMYVSPAASMVSPFSRGSVSISSASMEDAPLIDPNWLSDPADQEMAVAAFKRIRAMVDTDIIQSVIIGEEEFPGRDNVTTDEEILNHIRDNGIEIFHASATCMFSLSSSIHPLALGFNTDVNYRQNGHFQG